MENKGKKISDKDTFIKYATEDVKVPEVLNELYVGKETVETVELFLKKCLSKKQELGSIIKTFCADFPFNGGKGFGLYGGFQLGLNEFTGFEEENNIMEPEFQNDFYQKKAEFMVKQIKNFFDNKDKGILVCPEYDYDTKLNHLILSDESIKNIPCGNYLNINGIYINVFINTILFICLYCIILLLFNILSYI